MNGSPPAAARASAAHDSSLDLRQVGLVLLARWRIGVRSATRSPGRLLLSLLGVVLQVAFVTVLTVLAGAGMAHLVGSDGRAAADAAVHAGFLATFLWLAASPPLGLRGNEFLDVTKLFTLPVSPRTVLAATLAGLSTSTSVLVLVLPLACAVLVRAVLAGTGGVLDAVAGISAVAAVAGLGILSGQTLLLLFLGVFRSRRWRDLSVVLLTLLSASVYVAVRFGILDGGAATWRPALLAFGERKDWFLALPSWWGAHAATSAGPTRFLPLLASLPLFALLFRAATTLVRRAYDGEIEERTEVPHGAARGLAGRLARFVPDPLGALLEKDLRLLGRDPSMRLQMLHHFAYVGVPIVILVLRARPGEDGVPSSAVQSFLVAGFVFASLPLHLNPLASEGAGIAHAFSLPVDRARWLLGKSLSLVLVLGGGSAAGVLLLGTALGVWFGGQGFAESAGRSALGAVECLAAAGVAAGVGAVAGVVAPSRVVTRDRRALRQASGGGGGCLRAVFGLAAAGAVVVLLLPVALAFHLPQALPAGRHGALWTAVALPFGLLWGALALLAGTWAGGRIARRREEGLVADLSRADP